MRALENIPVLSVGGPLPYNRRCVDRTDRFPDAYRNPH